jgi:hypothetical protein
VAVANCPACGGPIEFTIGSSIVVVCDHCRSVVARTDRALEDLGKVAALVDTGSPLRRDLPGKFPRNRLPADWPHPDGARGRRAVG